MFYFLIVDENGVPGKLIGPMEWDDGVAKIISMVENDPDLDNQELSPEDKDLIKMDGYYEYIDGGCLYLLMAESD